MTDRVAAIVDAFYGMSESDRKKALMRALGDISVNKLDQKIMKIVMDSDVLIKITKTGSKEIIVSLLEVVIPKRVHEETVIESEGSPDARKIQENINEGKIRVLNRQVTTKGRLKLSDFH